MTSYKLDTEIKKKDKHDSVVGWHLGLIIRYELRVRHRSPVREPAARGHAPPRAQCRGLCADLAHVREAQRVPRLVFECDSGTRRSSQPSLSRGPKLGSFLPCC